MSRISSSSFKVNSNLEQICEIANASLPINDTNIIAELQNIDGTMQNVESACNNTDSSVQTLDATCQSIDSSVQSVDSTLQGTLNVSDVAAQADLTLLAGTVSGGRLLVTTGATAANSGSHGNMDLASVVIVGDNSTAIAVTAATNISLFGNHTGNSEIEVYVSADDIDYYQLDYGVYPNSSGDFFQKINGVAVNYIRLTYTGGGTVTATCLFN
jgi:hypothetical protein